MMHSPFVPGLFGLFAAVLWGAAVLAVIAVAVVVIVLLVRFLLVGTRAAKLYVAQHEPQAAATLSDPPPVVPPAPAPPDSDATS